MFSKKTKAYSSILARLAAIVALSFLPLENASAQFIRDFDEDIRALRNNAAGSFSNEYDDVLQLSPAAIAYALKAFGCESRSSWDRMAASHAISAAAMLSMLAAGNYAVGRETPGGEPHSFPSGHSSVAFMAATMLHYEYGWKSPWWTFAGYSLASTTAATRLLNDKHWATDVIGGAVLGICSTHLGYFLADLLFKEKGLNPDWTGASRMDRHPAMSPTLGVGFGRRFILGNGTAKDAGDIPYRGSGVDISGTVPLNGWLGIRAKGSAGSMIFRDGDSFNLYCVKAGACGSGYLAGHLFWETEALAGYAAYKRSGGPDFSAAASLGLFCGDCFKLKMQLGVETFRYPAADRRWLNCATAGCSASIAF